MKSYALTADAVNDLKEIARYTARTWGKEQVKRYIHSFHDCFSLLVTQPLMGRACDYLGAGIRRHEHQHHVIFYKKNAQGPLILRIKHKQSLIEIKDFGR